MKTLQITALTFIVSVFILACNTTILEDQQQPGKFKTGQIILPDYACIDTMIVVDAAGLNRDIIYAASDIEISDCLYKYCAVYGQPLSLLRDYQIECTIDSITLFDGNKRIGSTTYDKSKLINLILNDNK